MASVADRAGAGGAGSTGPVASPVCRSDGPDEASGDEGAIGTGAGRGEGTVRGPSPSTAPRGLAGAAGRRERFGVAGVGP